MNVNNIYSDITSFWDSIYPIILFHIIFYFTYRFVFGNFSLKSELEKYTTSDNFERTKKLFQQFELWTKLPFILLISALIYLALFNSLTSFVSSVKIFPFTFTYSTQEFMKEYVVKEDLTDIAKYSNDTTGNYYKIDQMRAKYLDEYKVKYPERYESWVGWAEKSFIKRLRYLHLAQLLIILMTFLFFRLIARNKEKRFKIILRFIMVFTLSLPILFILRYQTEQKVEERFVNEIVFVKNELTTDNSFKQIWSERQIESVERKWDNEKKHNNLRNDLFWISRYVERSKFLEAILGRRKLHSFEF